MVAFALLALSSVLLAAAPPATSAPGGCSSDVFSIDGSSVAVGLCTTSDEKAGAKTIVTETLSVKGQPPFVRDVPLDRVPGADTSRAIDDVSLVRLGLARTLHVTIAVKNGIVRLEHALLVPGAIALK
jgi:hypothetical protein